MCGISVPARSGWRYPAVKVVSKRFGVSPSFCAGPPALGSCSGDRGPIAACSASPWKRQPAVRPRKARSCHWARRGSSQRKVARRSPTHRSTRGSNQHSSKHHCRSGRPLPDFLPAPCLHACSGSRLLSATRITSRSLRKDKKDKKTPHLVINIINQRLTSLSPTFIS